MKIGDYTIMAIRTRLSKSLKPGVTLYPDYPYMTYRNPEGDVSITFELAHQSPQWFTWIVKKI